MEVAVRGQSVLLTTHQNYRELDEGNAIQDVMNYPPFLQYLAECEASGPVPNAFVIRHVQRIAHRVIGVTVDVRMDEGSVAECASTARRVRIQRLRWANDAPALLLPIIVEQETNNRYALLRPRRRLALGLQTAFEALNGCVQSSAEANTSLRCITAHDAQLSAIGFDLNKTQPVTAQSYTLGDEGYMPLRLFAVSTTFTQTQLLPLLSHDQGTPTAQATAQSATNVDQRENLRDFVAVPLSKAMTHGDLKTRLVCALYYSTS